MTGKGRPRTSKRSPFGADASGAAALEFALIAPILIFGALAAIDVGLSVHENFRIDSSLRAAAELTLEDPGAALVVASLNDMRGADVAWSAQRYCACPESPSANVACLTSCADDRPTGIFYRIAGELGYQGLFLPQRTLRRELKVRAR